jgi:fluoride exporter
MTIILVAALGVGGVLARYGLGLLLPPVNGISLAVLSANLLGSAIGGLLLGSPWVAERIPAPWLAALTIGLLGGLTTFSAVTLDTVRLWQNGAVNLAIFNLFLNNFSGILACYVGFKFGARIA